MRKSEAVELESQNVLETGKKTREAVELESQNVLETGKKTSSTEIHSKKISCILSMCCLSDNRLVCGSSDGTIRVWDLATGSSDLIYPEGYAVNALCRLLNKEVACGFSNGFIEILKEYEDKRFRRTSLVGHGASVTKLCRVGDTHLASGSLDRTIMVWKLEDGLLEHTLFSTLPVGALCYLKKDQLAGGYADNTRFGQ